MPRERLQPAAPEAGLFEACYELILMMIAVVVMVAVVVVVLLGMLAMKLATALIMPMPPFAQKPWSRHLVIAMFSLIIVYASILGALNLIHHAVMWRAIINASVFGAASIWYFYFRPNVAAYFRELRGRHNL